MTDATKYFVAMARNNAWANLRLLNACLKLTAEELERRTDLEKETITDIRKILKAEFEKE